MEFMLQKRQIAKFIVYFILNVEDLRNYEISTILFILFIILCNSWFLLCISIILLLNDDYTDKITNVDIILIIYHIIYDSMIFFVILPFLCLYFKLPNNNKIPLFTCCFTTKIIVSLFIQ
jgi:hypothetical protein